MTHSVLQLQSCKTNAKRMNPILDVDMLIFSTRNAKQMNPILKYSFSISINGDGTLNHLIWFVNAK
ncbi:hypothetical protein Hanom_Chr03g00216581 [Helianthus anomalus]